jgi:hypothetical protein
MAKGQKRNSSREAKKPKATKKPATALTTSADRTASVLAPQRRPAR